MSMNKQAIVFNKVTKMFPNAAKAAVNETSLVIEEGSFVTILGASGSGKTTLLKMVNRLIEPSSGTISMHGKNIRDMDPTELRRQIGYVIQQIGLFPHMTIQENIATVPKILGWESKRINERVDFLMELTHLPLSCRESYPRQLSGGQQQRVGIARAMAGDPEIMLMDEPFGAIDAITRSRLQDELKQIQRRLNKTVLFVTHDVEEALKLGSKIVIMNEGTIQQYDTPLQILAYPANDFVSQLIQADDIIQRYHLIQAGEVMVPLIGSYYGNEPTVARTQSLKEVLHHILQSHTTNVIVVDEDGRSVGRVTLAELQAVNAAAVPIS